MSGRPRRACCQCNVQKVRCSGHRPSCERCLRLGRPCLYGGCAPAPASLQAKPRGESSTEDSVNPAQPPVASVPSPAQSGSDKVLSCIPPSLVRALIDLFFSHVYNAPLLLHESTFLQAFAAGTVRSHVTLSICAIASRYYHDAYDKTILSDNGFSTRWAERASKLTLHEVDDPREDNIVALINLAHFWYSQGAWRKFYIHKCLATQTAEILGLSVENLRRKHGVEAELQRRRFWACYLINAFSTEKTTSPEESNTTIQYLTLPCDERDFVTDKPSSGTTLAAYRSNGAIYAELIKAMSLWTTVSSLIKNKGLSTASRIAAIQNLNDDIYGWWSNMHMSLALTPETMSSASTNILPLLLLIHIVYHQSLCSLHASIVPFFSWCASDGSWLHARQASAQIALEHANAASALFHAALQCDIEDGRLSSFLGYSAYCCCAIQIPFLWCTNVGVQERARSSVAVNLRTIECLGKYWKFVALLGDNIRSLYELHADQPYLVDDEPKYMNPSTLAVVRSSEMRVSASILRHNEVLWDVDGKIAKQDVELTDSCLPGERHSMPPVVTEGIGCSSIAPVAEPERSSYIYRYLNLQHAGIFQPYFDLDLFNTNFPFSSLDQMPMDENTESFEWLGELPFQTELIPPNQ